MSSKQGQMSSAAIRGPLIPDYLSWSLLNYSLLMRTALAVIKIVFTSCYIEVWSTEALASLAHYGPSNTSLLKFLQSYFHHSTVSFKTLNINKSTM